MAASAFSPFPSNLFFATTGIASPSPAFRSRTNARRGSRVTCYSYDDDADDSRVWSSRTVADPYHTLGVSQGASEQDIKKAYRRLALKFHPDVCKGDSCTSMFTQISDAYQTIMDCLRGHEGLCVVGQHGTYDEAQPEQMMGVNDDTWEDWEEWMGWEGAGIRDYSSHINYSL